MRKSTPPTRSWKQRAASLAMAAVMAFGVVPGSMFTFAAETTTTADYGVVATVADPEALTRPEETFAGSTLNSGKILVGKSVSDEANQTIDDHTFTIDEEGNFLVTVSQSAQTHGISSEIPVPLDVVFVLDTSGSMNSSTSNGSNRAKDVVAAANSAIATLMQLNENNRVAVVAFSSEGFGYGGQTDRKDESEAASVLSSLGHYTDAAASSHITWNRSGSTIYGRSASGAVSSSGRSATNGGTNIQAGIAMGAKLLMEADTTVTLESGQTLTRMPFLVILSDGAATFSSTSADWKNPSYTSEQGPGNDSYAGNGFLAALTAAYYKDAISEHYYGSSVSETNRASIYTIGVGLTIGNREGEGTRNEKLMAQVTLNPKDNYDSTTNSHAATFRSYWTSYQTEGANARGSFTVSVNNASPSTYTFRNYNESTTEIDNIDSSVTSLKYNDAYYAATSQEDINAAFEKLVIEIQLRALTDPTYVSTTWGEDFSGYVTFTDPIGEYMEVKDVEGIIDGQYLYQGKSFAELAVNYGQDVNPAFDAELFQVLKTRILASYEATGTEADAEAAALALLTAAAKSTNQLYYTADGSSWDNSIVWYAKEYPKTMVATASADGSADNAATPIVEFDSGLQYLAPADNDSVAFLQSATDVPTGATHVVRSYFFRGTAGGENTDPADMLCFVVRVARSLTAPYQQTVTISAPASLLSVQSVLIDDTGDTAEAHYSELVPARVVYEVGLREDINAANMTTIVDADYLAANANDEGGYYFYTNEWDRTAAADSHLRAMTSADFYANPENSYYAFSENTPLYTDAAGSTRATTVTAGQTYYYPKTYYTWDASAGSSGAGVAAEKQTEWIAITIPASFSAANGSNVLKQDADGWYIAAGVYNGDAITSLTEDILKDPNKTGTSRVVTHPIRTYGVNDSHYTILLGNNGRLTFVPAEPTKSVGIYADENAAAPTVTDADGKAVVVGQVLEYTITVPNAEKSAADITITDAIPTGTQFVSATDGGTVSADGKTVRWTFANVAAGNSVTVSFKVLVTEAAIQNSTYQPITNQATATIGGNAYKTNVVTNPPQGKTVAQTSAPTTDTGLKVGDTITYNIVYKNDTDQTATVTITDTIPTGTTFVSATAGGTASADGRTVTWQIQNVASGQGGVVSVTVQVNVSAVSPVVNGATIQIGENGPAVETNSTSTELQTGSLALTKTVQGTEAADRVFTLVLTESTGTLTGTYAAEGVEGGAVTFAGGAAQVQLQAGDTVTITGLAVGTVITVTELDAAGYTAGYQVGSGAATSAGAAVEIRPDTQTVTVINTYAPVPLDITFGGVKAFTSLGSAVAGTFGMVAQRVQEKDGAWVPVEPEYFLSATVELDTADGTNGSVSQAFQFWREITAPATEYYLVSETDGGQAGVDYDGTQYLIRLEVTDPDGDGQMTAALAYKAKAEGETAWPTEWTTVTAAAAPDQVAGKTADVSFRQVTDFTNQYKPDTVQLSLQAEKTLANRTLEANQFSFEATLTAITGIPAGASTALQVGDKTTGVNAADGSVTFRQIDFDAPGVYTFTITETNGGLHGYTYDAAVYTAVVTVTDTDGKLSAGVAYYQGEEALPAGALPQFSNTYTPDGVTVTLEGTKTLTGRDLAHNEFHFAVYKDGTLVSGGHNEAAANGQPGAITFEPLGYTMADLADVDAVDGVKTKILTYTVKEVIPDTSKLENVTYDATEFTVTVTLTYDTATGTLTATPAYPTGGIAFRNGYTPSAIKWQPTGAVKSTEGNPPDGIQFSYRILSTATGSVVANGTSAANGSVTFGEITFTAAGTYTYWVQEANRGQSSNGVTYDAARYLLQVTVEQDPSTGVLSVTSAAYYALAEGAADEQANYTAAVSAPAFRNEYAAAGSLTVQAHKTFEGRALQANAFSFKMVREGADSILHTGTNAADGTITFGTLFFTDADFGEGKTEKEYTYLVTETVPEQPAPGVTYSEQQYRVTVTLTRTTGSEQIGAQVTKVEAKTGEGWQTVWSAGDAGSYDQAIAFANTGAPYQGASVTVDLSKTLTGRDLNPNEFTFAVTRNGNPVATAAADANGNAAFTLTYPAATALGEYTYLVAETNNSLGGVTYDQTQYQVTVKVTDADKDGCLEAAVTAVTKVRDAEGASVSETLDTNATLSFANTYKASGTSINLEAAKTLTGRALNAGEFSFAVKDPTGAVVASGVNDADGKVVFSSIGYSAAGTYTYTVYEVAGHLPGVRYDEQTFQVTVTVTEDTVAGTLTAVATYPEGGVHFTNRYAAKSTSLTFATTKTLTGRALGEGEFDFAIRDENGAIVATGSNAANGSVVFSPIGFTHEMLGGKTSAEFHYVMVENAGTLPNVSYDATQYPFTVILQDDGNGQLITQVQIGSEAPVPVNGEEPIPVGSGFTNTYTPDPVGWSLTATKLLSGGKTLQAGAFTFELASGADDTTWTAVNDASGLITFPAVEFTAAGTYSFAVSEVIPAAAEPNEQGVYEQTLESGKLQYDSTVWTVTVTVTDDGKGNLSIRSVTCQAAGEAAAPAVVFTNTFVPDPVEVDPNPGAAEAKLSAAKLLNGGQPGKNFDGAFTFEIVDQNDLRVAVGTNDADGRITFLVPDTDTPFVFRFDAVGVYGYTMREVVPAAEAQQPGVGYDTTGHHFHIEVTQDAETGALSATVVGITHPDGEEDQTAQTGADTLAITFRNSYKAAPVEVTISDALSWKALHKELTDGSQSGRTLQAGEFRFALLQVVGDNEYIVVAEGTNDADGNVIFPTLTYTEPGTHEYLLAEANTQQPGIGYDAALHTVRVLVTDEDADGNLLGQLQATVSYNGGAPILVGSTVSAPQVTFTNTYYGEPVTVTVTAAKRLEGKSLTGSDFTFVLESADGEKLEATNAASGVITFALGQFDQVGTYTYKLYEAAGRDAHVTYDDAVHQIVVTVTDDGKGYLKAVVTSDGLTETPTFTNTYTPDPIAVELKANKVLEGRILLPGEFSFQLHDGAGNLVAEARNGLLGGVTLKTDKIITAAGTYTFTMSEVQGTAAGISYDTTRYTVEVTVVNNDGTLEIASVKYPADGVTFRNVYGEEPVPSQPASPDTGDNTALMLWAALMLLSGMGIPVCLVQMRRKRRTARH